MTIYQVSSLHLKLCMTHMHVIKSNYKEGAISNKIVSQNKSTNIIHKGVDV